MACLIAGILGCGGGPPILFFPPRRSEAAGLEEGVGWSIGKALGSGFVFDEAVDSGL
jgi:hypothetical protein